MVGRQNSDDQTQDVYTNLKNKKFLSYSNANLNDHPGKELSDDMINSTNKLNLQAYQTQTKMIQSSSHMLSADQNQREQYYQNYLNASQISL